MKTVLLRLIAIVLATIAAALSLAGTLTVTSPTEGSFLGKSNQIKFNIQGASVQVTVTAVITYPDGSTTTISDKFTPGFDGNTSGSLPLNFGDSSPEGNYTITVSATEPNNTYAPTTVHVKVDVISPKFEEVTPTSNGFVKGVVHIRASVKETNVKDWRVQVNSQDIPNNTGTGNSIAVDWDTSSIVNDGAQTVTIKVDDEAGNSTTQTINLTVDRVAPVVTITYPQASTGISPNSDVTVIVDIKDASSSSVDRTGLDVLAKRTDGTYITRVTLTSFNSTGNNTFRWVGRIRYKKNLLPSTFKIVASAMDRAGNVATPQEVTLNVGRSRH